MNKIANDYYSVVYEDLSPFGIREAYGADSPYCHSGKRISPEWGHLDQRERSSSAIQN